MKLSTLKKTLPVVQRVVIYGPPKSGKTQLVSQLAEHFNLKWFDLENGMSPLLKLPADWQERIDLVKIPDSKDLPIAVETMLKVISGAKLEICSKHGKAKCLICAKDPAAAATMSVVELNALGPRDIVVIDSLTQLASSAMNWIMKDKGDDFKPERDQWGQLKYIMEKFLSNVQQARYNVVCITHEDEVEMVDGRDKLVPVSGSRATSRNTAKYFDHVVYCNVANKKHAFGSATTYAASVLSGSRLDVNIEGLAVPSLLPFFQHLLEFPLEIISASAASAASAQVANTVEQPAVDVAQTAATPATPATPSPANSVGNAALERLRAMKEKK